MMVVAIMLPGDGFEPDQTSRQFFRPRFFRNGVLLFTFGGGRDPQFSGRPRKIESLSAASDTSTNNTFYAVFFVFLEQTSSV
jgi:hypothetical protein